LHQQLCAPRTKGASVSRAGWLSVVHLRACGQELPSGTGASWQLLEGAREVDVPEVGKQPAVRWLRPNGASLQLRGSFFAVPVTDPKGMVVGLVAADTCLPGMGVPSTVSLPRMLRPKL
jgi:hypothetical protein